MGIFALGFLIVALVLVGVGIAIGLAACVCAVALIGLGMVSSSVVIGLRSGRTAVGIRVFLLQCGVLAGIPAGAICAWLAQSFIREFGQGWQIFVYGGLGGAFAGTLVALMLDFVSRRLHAFAASRYQALRSDDVNTRMVIATEPKV